MEIDRNDVERAFRQYVSAYNAEDPKIKLKIDHTYRVAGLCERIAADISRAGGAAAGITGNVPHVDAELAWLAGMLHDIGRFEQVRRYGTFSDAKSVDHAQFGADLLFGERLPERAATEPGGLLETFVPGYRGKMSEAERSILETSIRCHSLFRLPEDLDERERAYCHILRDADKIDIFRVNCDTPMEEIYNVSAEELRNAKICEEVKACFRNRTAVYRPLRKSAADILVGHICLFFELEFPISRRIAREQGYLNRMLDFRSDDPDTQAWFAYMKQDLRSNYA